MTPEFEAMKEFRDSSAVVGINKILNEKGDAMSKENRQWGIDKLIQFSRSAMAKVGITADENGQWEFADLIFFDMQMSNENKIEWLSQCEGQESRINALKSEAGNVSN